jgi:carbon-monoxide dehydrogenase medium subunit
MLEGKKIDEKFLREVGEIAASETKPITDVRSTAEYRRRVSGVLVSRALVTATERARRQPS